MPTSLALLPLLLSSPFATSWLSEAAADANVASDADADVNGGNDVGADGADADADSMANALPRVGIGVEGLEDDLAPSPETPRAPAEEVKGMPNSDLMKGAANEDASAPAPATTPTSCGDAAP